MKNRSCFKTVLALALAFALLTVSVSAFAKPWKFGVMDDTQWTCPDDPAGQNPNSVSVSILHQINQQFINHGVEFVIQVGDLTDDGSDAGIATRAEAAKELYLAGIGFFPMRGIYESNPRCFRMFSAWTFRLMHDIILEVSKMGGRRRPSFLVSLRFT